MRAPQCLLLGEKAIMLLRQFSSINLVNPILCPLRFQSITFFLGRALQTLKLRRRLRRPGLCQQRSPVLERRAHCLLQLAGEALQQTTQMSPRPPRGLQTRPIEDKSFWRVRESDRAWQLWRSRKLPRLTAGHRGTLNAPKKATTHCSAIEPKCGGHPEHIF